MGNTQTFKIRAANNEDAEYVEKTLRVRLHDRPVVQIVREGSRIVLKSQDKEQLQRARTLALNALETRGLPSRPSETITSNGICVLVVTDSPLKIPVDSVVCTVDQQLSPNTSAAADIVKAAGKELLEQAFSDKGTINIAEVLPCKKVERWKNVIAVCSPDCENRDDVRQCCRNMESAIKAALDTAAGVGMESVLVPLVGLGK
jgi:hypothetical protein